MQKGLIFSSFIHLMNIRVLGRWKEFFYIVEIMLTDSFSSAKINADENKHLEIIVKNYYIILDR